MGDMLWESKLEKEREGKGKGFSSSEKKKKERKIAMPGITRDYAFIRLDVEIV